MARQRNVCWDALVEVTGANEDFTAGRIAAALKGIRAAALKEGFVSDEDIAEEIGRRAQAYRTCFPACPLTPTALATHWKRVVVEAARRTLTVEEQTLARLRHTTHGEVAL